MWSPTTQSGADVMKRIAAPMIGGVITSGILELLLYPVIYVFWRKRHLGTAMARPGGAPISGVASSSVEFAPLGVSAEQKPAPAEPAVPTSSRPTKPSHPRRRLFIVTVLLVTALGLGGFFAWQKLGHRGQGAQSAGTPFATQKVKDLTVNLIHPKGQLQQAMNDILIEFRDSASGELVDVGSVKFDLDMNMAGMVMHSGATIEPTGTSGQYRAKVKPDMAGDWMATLRYEGPRGNGTVSFSVNVKP